MKRRGILLMGAAGVACIGGAQLFPAPGEDRPDPAQTARLAFPGLAALLPTARRIDMRRGDQTAVLALQNGHWGVTAKQGYPALEPKVHALLAGLAELRLVEQRTSQPSLLPELGLDDPEKSGSHALLLRVLDGSGKALAEIVLGTQETRVHGGGTPTIYVRRPGQNQSWLAEGQVSTDSDPAQWINRDIANLPVERVLQVSVLGVGQAPLAFGRGGDANQPLRMTQPVGVPTDADALGDVGQALEFLTLLDVRRLPAPPASPASGAPAATAAAAGFGLPGTYLGEAEYTLTDSLVVKVWGASANQGNEFWIKLAAQGGSAEAQRFQALWQGWAYQVGAWKQKAFLPLLADLQAKPETPPAKPVPPMAPPASGDNSPVIPPSAPTASSPAPAPGPRTGPRAGPHAVAPLKR